MAVVVAAALTPMNLTTSTFRLRLAAGAVALTALTALALPTLPADSLEADSAAFAAIAADSASFAAWSAPMLLTDEMLAGEGEKPFSPEEFYTQVGEQMNEYAAQYLGRRYRLGATGPKAFDCSGFTQNIFRNFGMSLDRTSRAQWTQGENVDLDDVRPGDLLFFSGRRANKRVGHVAMVTSVDKATGKVEFIHASSSKGITYQTFPDNGYFSKRYLGARRYLGTEGFQPEVAANPVG